jgi:hypothetical protein
VCVCVCGCVCVCARARVCVCVLYMCVSCAHPNYHRFWHPPDHQSLPGWAQVNSSHGARRKVMIGMSLCQQASSTFDDCRAPSSCKWLAQMMRDDERGWVGEMRVYSFGAAAGVCTLCSHRASSRSKTEPLTKTSPVYTDTRGVGSTVVAVCQQQLPYARGAPNARDTSSPHLHLCPSTPNTPLCTNVFIHHRYKQTKDDFWFCKFRL